MYTALTQSTNGTDSQMTSSDDHTNEKVSFLDIWVMMNNDFVITTLCWRETNKNTLLLLQATLLMMMMFNLMLSVSLKKEISHTQSSQIH